MSRAVNQWAMLVGMLSWLVTVEATAGDSDRPCQAVFDDKKAAARVQEIADCYSANYDDGLCPYYGRLWKKTFARRHAYGDTGMTVWEHFNLSLKAAGLTPRRLDCTLYAQAILQAGMPRRDYERLRTEHRRIWGARGFAGWSVAYLLTEALGWHAYAIIDPDAPDHGLYMRYFKNRMRYPVWRQPAIRIEGYYISGRDDAAIEALLRQHSFGWGFSEGGIHTWFTQGIDLKECHFDAGPTRRYDVDLPYRLLETTRFTAFKDYHVHLVVFPSSGRKCRCAAMAPVRSAGTICRTTAAAGRCSRLSRIPLQQQGSQPTAVAHRTIQKPAHVAVKHS